MMLSKLLKFLTPSVISVLQAIGDIFKILLFTAIQTIEISIHTKIIKYFALEFGTLWSINKNYATNKTRFAANLTVYS